MLQTAQRAGDTAAEAGPTQCGRDSLGYEVEPFCLLNNRGCLRDGDLGLRDCRLSLKSFWRSCQGCIAVVPRHAWAGGCAPCGGVRVFAVSSSKNKQKQKQNCLLLGPRVWPKQNYTAGCTSAVFWAAPATVWAAFWRNTTPKGVPRPLAGRLCSRGDRSTTTLQGCTSANFSAAPATVRRRGASLHREGVPRLRSGGSVHRVAGAALHRKGVP